MKITVILCTYNRCQILAKALDSVAVLKLPESVEWEILVVDNNSRDQTRRVVEDFRQRFPGRFRYLFEPRQGKSYALNSGIQEALGDVVAFMDDDVTVEPTWLQNLTAHLDQSEWVGAAGRIVLQWPKSLPAWLSTTGPYARCPFPDFDLGQETKELTRPPFGANMAFRKTMFEKYGGFRTDLGPSASREIPCPNEDVEFGRRLLDAGEHLRYEPSAVVYHPVAPERITKKYFLNWWFDAGRAEVRAFGVRPGTKWHLAGIPLYLLRSLGLWTLRWVLELNPRVRFYLKIVVWGKVGGIQECYRQSRVRNVAVRTELT
jgi:glycosyltransferase involved in cell wall biosynthesis